MRISNLLIGAFLIAYAAGASAHTHLKEAVPANGSTLTASPEHIMLTFSEPTRVTALTLQKEGEAAQKLAPLPTEASAHVMVPAPKLAPGKYTVSWRAVGTDNHVMSGTVQFTVGGPAASASPPHAGHDHH
ncbi:MAG: copper resistance protein CopC [Steroidobacteraceae bacterium]|nr:copper resistance protein CopC [Steroidobacteraceae bacterium]